ncbi:MAG: PEP-CTERM sorting domain-containing protein [Ideonella sp.]|nr:PEP-CTERM sorting domain-containing protein [Ideonella sp.]
MHPFLSAALAAALLAPALPSQAAVSLYTRQAAYVGALKAQGLASKQETFENAGAWGDVRSTISGGFHTAQSVLSKGVTWSANFDGGEITTGDGAARRGSWGFFAYPHGAYGGPADCSLPGACGDGFMGASAAGFYAIGGWIRTNTPPADINLFLDGKRFDFGAASQISTGYAFFGAISSTPFHAFEFREMEGTAGELKYIFADDFRFALAPAVSALAVPEPSALALMLVGLGLTICVGRRRRQR